MYWTDWGSLPKIETSYMDGTSRRVLFNTNLVWPNGLTIDKINSKLYWADASLDKIEESDLSGSGRRVLISHSGIHPFGLTLFDGDLYWTDWANKSVYSLNIVSVKQRRIASGMAKPMDIHAYNKTSLQEGSNSCSVSNGGCSDLCLPIPNGRTCACSDGSSLNINDPTKCGQVSAVNCSAPRIRPNSFLVTQQCGRQIGATCSFACQSGYSFVGGNTTITCQQNGNWSGEGPTCEDTQAPVFASCPKDILVYAERGKTSSMVNWSAPNATDNSGEAPSVTRVTGYSPPVRLNQGIYNMTYSATDRVNNKALCSFKITVQVINCTSQNAIGVLRVTECNNYYGGTCNFTCPVGYRLVGMAMLTCFATNGGPPGVWNGAVPTCQANSQQPYVFVSNTTNILSVGADLTSSTPVLHNHNRAVAVDVHVTRGLIFWSDVADKRIKRASINGSDVKTIVNYFIGVCDGLAVDWTSDLIYWSDTTLNNIEVARIDGTNRRTLISDNLDEPRGVAVDPLSRLIFWTDWGKEPKIERAYLNGKNRRTIVSSSLGWPNDITLDHRYYKIYWVDALNDKIESSDYSGNHRTMLFHRPGIHPFGVDLLSTSLFWTDWRTIQGVHKLDLSTGAVQSNVTLSGTAMGIAVFDTSRQPSSINSCQQNNGGCSHLCLLTPSGYDCACPTGYGLGSDGRTCNTYIERFIIFTDADMQTTNIISLDVTYKTWKILHHHSNRSRPIAIDYDPVEKRIYWTDVSLRLIASTFMNATSVKVVFWKNVLVPDGLAVDYLGRNLYWTDTGTNRIEVGRLDGSARKTLIYQNLDEPRAIALYAERGTMYWTDWGSLPKIETSYMDGTSRRVLFNINLAWPNGLTIDKINSKLYWADASFDKIEESDLSGSGRRVLISHSGIHPFGLTLFDGDLYWTDWANKSVYSLNIVSGKQRRIASGMAKPMDIHAYNKTSLQEGSNGCSVSNGGCSDLCLPIPNGRTCACSDGSSLNINDPTKCGQVSAVNCSAPRIRPNSFLVTQRCGRQIGATCSFACRSGYSFVGGNTKITCYQNGTWSGEGPICAVINCTAPNVVGAVRVTGCNTNNGGTCNFTCPVGYRLVGMAMLTCLATNGGPPGVWNGAVPTCQDTQAPVFVSCPRDSSVYAERGKLSSVVTWAAPNATDNSGEAPNITRVTGYSPPVRLNQGTYRVTYSATDRSNNKALCSFMISVRAINCTSQNAVGVLQVTGCNNYFGGTCNFTCPVNYRLVGMETLMCLATNGGPPGVWNGAVPTCEAITCPALRVPANASRSGCSGSVNERVGTICQFQCIHGYRPFVVVSRTCRQNGTWSGSDLSCSAVMCPPLTKPIHGTLTPASCLQYSHYGSVCTLSCDNGFQIGGTTSRTCTSNSIWTGQNDTRCEDITPPTFSASCPNNKVYDLDQCSNNITVNWTIPTAKDNSGVVRIVDPSHGPPLTLFSGVYTINYTAIDPTGNTKRCSFKIQVNKHVCRHPTNPVNGFLTSLTCNNVYGSVATFSCRSGYTISGSRTRSCLSSGQWSGVYTTCRRVTCPALSPLNFGTIEPPNCHTGLPVVSGTWCLFKCNLTNGYKNVGPDRTTCIQNGTWSEDVSKISCQDHVPPSLRCPQDTKLATDPGKDVSTFYWTIPTPTDNSGDQPSLTVKPDGIAPPYEFPVGNTMVEYTAKDSSNLKTRCSFTVTVRDKEAPTKVYCPPDFEVTSDKTSTEVYFPRAKFVDNVGVTRIITDRYNGSKMSYGEHNVTYTAYDRAGNTATCVIKITVSSISCEKPEHPKHGALSCLTLTGGMYCTVHCFKGYVFPVQNPLQICTNKGKWITKKVPDCKEPQIAKVTLEGIVHYIAKQCESRKEAIRKQFMAKMQKHYMANMHCKSDTNLCKLKKIEVTCRKARKRRSVDENDRVDISFEMELPLVKNASADLNKTVAELKSSVMETINKSVSKLEVDGQVITLDKSSPSTLKFVSLSCEPGQVLKDAVCVKCPSGYFMSLTTKSCSPCPANQYQELEGETSCKTCPSGTSGAEGEIGSTSNQSCLKDRGTGSPTTMIAAIVVSLVVAILLAMLIWILKRRQCICRKGPSEIKEGRQRIVYGPKAKEEYAGPSILNPTYEECHVYAEIGDPRPMYANLDDDIFLSKNMALRFENGASFNNQGFRMDSQA
ncbi:sushi, von Willebrand factor type A, EGF and pentraxin domain-containing protein 1-like [Actinia tenebrosa]|uniref:Sushi, von Willebrand factor type A, EGF and pentraxin domain-containing protein 1-like n=1 Tax=Actinia tenebrosa TaxID=6105 RepID=A0A6P8HX57_ACTTE|nr:sushi, von Willebrand factor type A, EGF and pentraxin domain-containing protein 1-like [Actinia tenebrosa]